MGKRARTEEGDNPSSSKSPSGAKKQKLNMKEKTLLLEKGMNLAEIEDDRFGDILAARDWFKLVGSPVQPNETLVKEFYRVCTQKNDEEDIVIRGKTVDISSSLVNSFYYLRDVDQGIKEGLDTRVESIKQFEVLKAYPNPSNPTSDVVYSELNISDALLINMLRSVVMPRKSASRLEKVEKQFLICVKRGWKIDIGELVIAHIKRLISNLQQCPKKQKYLYYPSLITGLLKDQGISFSKRDMMSFETRAMGSVLMDKVKKSRWGKDSPEIGVPARRRPRTDQVGGSFSVATSAPATETIPSVSTSAGPQLPPEDTQPIPVMSEPPVQSTTVGGHQEILEAINGVAASLKQELQATKQHLEARIEEQVQLMCNRWKEDFLASIEDPFRFAEEWRRNREERLRKNFGGFSQFSPLAASPGPSTRPLRNSPSTFISNLFCNEDVGIFPSPPHQQEEQLITESEDVSPLVTRVEDQPTQLSTISSPSQVQSSSPTQIPLIPVQTAPVQETVSVQGDTFPEEELSLFSIQEMPSSPVVFSSSVSTSPPVVLHLEEEVLPALQHIQIRELQERPGASLVSTQFNQLVSFVPLPQLALQDSSVESDSTLSPSQWSSPLREMLDQLRDSDEDPPQVQCFIKEQQISLRRAEIQATTSSSLSSPEPVVVQPEEEDPLAPTPNNQLVIYLPPAQPLRMQSPVQTVQEPQLPDSSDTSGSSDEWPSPVKKIVREAREKLQTPIQHQPEGKFLAQLTIRSPITGFRRPRGPVKISDAEEPPHAPHVPQILHSKKKSKRIGEADDPTVQAGEVVPDTSAVDVSLPYVQVSRKRIKSVAQSKRTNIAAKKKEVVEAALPPQKRITRAAAKQKEIANATPSPLQQQAPIKVSSSQKKRRRLVKKYSDSPPVANLMLTPRNPTLDTPLSMARNESEPEDSI